MSFPRYPKYKDSGVEWLGEVPEGWEVSRIKQLASVISKGTTPTTVGAEFSDEGVRFLKAENITEAGVSTDPEFFISVEAHSMLSRSSLEFGDVLVVIAGATTGKSAVMPKGLTPANTNQAVSFIRPQRRPFSDYISLWLGTRMVRDLILLKSVQSAQPNLSMEDLGNTPIPVPPSDDLEAICQFLATETRRIDELVAEQQRLMELLKEKRQAVISHAVTKGLNPRAPMKPSGIEWLGDVPEHWEVTHLRRLAAKGTTITYGIVQAGPDIEDGIPYIRTSDMAGECLPESGYLRTTQEIDAAYSRSKVKPNDLVVAIRASLGKGLLVPNFLDGANLTQGTARVSPGKKLLPPFLFWAFNSEYCQTSIRVVAKGTTFLEITLDALRRIPLAVPPMAEQAAIVAFLASEIAKLDALSAEAQKAIDLLQERRTALISAAVTGQIDVRKLAAA